MEPTRAGLNMLDPYEQEALKNIEHFGWHLLHINNTAPEPEFVYSVGMMHTLKHPEIIMFGLHGRVMAQNSK